MLAVLMSMKQSWWDKILAGEKDLEIRKSAPRSGKHQEFEWPVAVLVYVSGTGAVQGQFMCPGVVRTNFFPYLSKRSCVPLNDLVRYADGKDLCGWIVSEPERYDPPSPLAEFGLTHPPMSWQYIEIPNQPEVPE